MGINIRRSYNHSALQKTIRDRFIMLLEGDSDPFHIQIANNLIVLKLKKEDHHWWSPEMNLRLESEEKGTMIFEVIG